MCAKSDDRFPLLREDEAEALRESDLKRDAPFFLYQVQNNQLAVALYYGGCQAYGYEYKVIDRTTNLIRRDVLKFIKKYRVKKKKEQATAAKKKQGRLF